MSDIPKRRGFLLGAGALLMAPAIVRASSLMPTSALNLVEQVDMIHQGRPGLVTGEIITISGLGPLVDGTYTVVALGT
jgi:hypothetical protein